MTFSSSFNSCGIRAIDIPHDTRPDEIRDLFIVPEFYVVDMDTSTTGLEGLIQRRRGWNLKLGLGALATREVNDLTGSCQAHAGLRLRPTSSSIRLLFKAPELNGRICNTKKRKLDIQLLKSYESSPLMPPPISYEEILMFRSFNQHLRVNSAVDSTDDSAFWFKLPPPLELDTAITSVAHSGFPSRNSGRASKHAISLFARCLAGAFVSKYQELSEQPSLLSVVRIESLAAGERFA
ncbi:uncharacterized protein ARMOST_10439 [Armillaria ostoyae]|uniref:Uncharacterized protein n=1 Tax=Armillaria ostoyae TaxID=47428 RepID=A0A284REC4_ARMOS|nr:uncharacterized protein ARMOST_10439 [Armillaria ostoyae]